jgi:hypothetical protein
MCATQWAASIPIAAEIIHCPQASSRQRSSDIQSGGIAPDFRLALPVG